jgi:RND family efflux transporter MFP subunit
MVLAMAGCKDRIEPGSATVARPAVSGIATMTAEWQKTPLYHEATATVAPVTESMISGRVMGPVATMLVTEGDRVKAGQLLITIDSAEIRSRVAAAGAAHREALQALSAAERHRALAEKTYSRFRNLFDEKALSLQELDKIETQKEVASIEYERIQEMVKRTKAGLVEAEVFQGYTKIVAPVTGVVTARFADPGTMAMPGMLLLTIEDTSRYRLEAEIDESLTGRVVAGMSVEVTIRALDKTGLPGKITEIVPAVDPRSRTFKVFIGLEVETALHSGLFARVRIPVGEEERILVPAASIATRGQLTGVYVVGADRVITFRLVRPGGQYGERTEILSGLNPGETFVAEDISSVTDGSILEAEK